MTQAPSNIGPTVDSSLPEKNTVSHHHHGCGADIALHVEQAHPGLSQLLVQAVHVVSLGCVVVKPASRQGVDHLHLVLGVAGPDNLGLGEQSGSLEVRGSQYFITPA